MKRLTYISAILLSLVVLAGCRQTSTTSYSALLNKEKTLMREYIKRNEITVVDTLPSTEAFLKDPKLYYEVQGYERLYYHLDRMGDSITIIGTDTFEHEAVRRGDQIIMRYKQFTLTEYPDTADYWTTLNAPYPTEFKYMVDNNTCTAWHVAVQLMKYSNSECTILVPSRFGDNLAQNSVTPYGYKLKMQIKL